MSDLPALDADWLEPPPAMSSGQPRLPMTMTAPEGILPANNALAPQPQPLLQQRPSSGPLTPAPQTLGDPNNPYQAYGMNVAQQYGVPWNLMYHQIAGESGWNPNVGRSSAGAGGIAQFIPPTAKQYGVDVSNWQSGLLGNAKYMSDLYKQAGSWTGALTGYLTGRPGGPIPQDVLRQNASYAEAYRTAAQLDAQGVGLANTPRDPLDPEPMPGTTRLAAGGAVPQQAVQASNGLSTPQTPATTDGMQQLGQTLQAAQAPAESPWNRLMMLSMIQKLASAGTHQFTPVPYDPWKYVPRMQRRMESSGVG